jgi:iron complex outermembrane receptor protein
VDNDYLPFEDTGGFEGGVFQNMAVFNPTRPVVVTDSITGQPVFFEIGTGRQSVRNPVALADQIADFGSTTRVLGNIRTQLDILSSLRGQLIVGVDRSQGTRKIYFPRSSPVGAEFNGLARQEDRDLTAITLQSLLTWSQRVGEAHDFEVIGGYEFNDYAEGGFASEARDFLTDAFSFDALQAGARVQTPSSYRNDSRLIGFFSRVTYGFNDRYFLTGVLRRDGSSRFGPENKWGTFPAISGSWRISEESFMRDRLFSELRFRVGYGLQGNEAAQPYASLLLLSPSDQASYPFGDQKTVGVAPTRNPNPDLKWEQTSQFNLGLDYGFSDNRIAGSLDYYVKNTSDLLLDVTVPQPAGVATRLENIGKVRNRGVEATLDALLFTRANMSWQAGVVFAAERNKVVDLGGASFIRTGDVSGQGQSGQVAQRILPDQPLGTFFGPEYVGVNDQGQQLFNQYEVERDDAGREISRTLIGQTTSPGGDDFVVIGNASPDFTVGFRSQLRLGGLDASFIMRWEQGRDVFNNTALVYATKGNANQDKNFLASALEDSIGINEPAIYSSRWIEDGSFLRLQNITLGYTFEMPAVLASVANTARVYVSADNLLLLTGYSGYDPEAHSSAGLASRGIDYLSYPRPRVFTAGLRLSF